MDSTLTAVWTTVGAASLTLAAVHGLIWLLDRRNLANLAFCGLALSVAAMARMEFGLMHAASAEEYAQIVRWFHVPLFFFTAGLVIFVRLHFRTGRVALGGAVVALRGVVTVANLLGPSTSTWQVLRLEQVPWLGKLVNASAVSVMHPIQWLATAVTVLLMFYVIDASLALWRSPQKDARRKALVVGGATAIFVVASATMTQLVIWGLARIPIMLSPPFLIILAAMTYELCRDIVAAARIEREASEQRTQLTHLSRVAMLGELSGGIAHELNQPLTAILSNAQAAQLYLANNTATPQALSEILHDIVLADKHAGEVIRRLRALFKRSEEQFHPLEVNMLVSDALDIVRGDLITKGIELERDLGQGLPRVNGDNVELQQVLLNLVLNACEAMSSMNGSASRRLLVRSRLVEGSVDISVHDSGPGFAAEQAARLFEAFYTTKPQGLGLGLSISRAIVRAHGGEIIGATHPGRGASFRILLPPLPAAI